MKNVKIGALLLSGAMLMGLTACSTSTTTPADTGSAAVTATTDTGSGTAAETSTAAQKLLEYDFTPSALTADKAADAVDTYFTIPASRDESVRIPVGVSMPALDKGETCPVVVLVHGFLGSKDEEFGFYANATEEKYDYESMADQLLAKGIGTIRIDQPGSGESEDDFRNYTLNNSVSDLQDAYDYSMANFAFDAEKVGLVGWSMGGKVGPKFASQNDNISTMVLLNPAGDNGNTSLLTASAAGLDWEALEADIKDGEVHNTTASEFAGRELYMSEDFFKQVDASTTGDEIKAFLDAGNTGLLIYGDKDSVINPETYAWLIANTSLSVECITGMDHDLGLESERPDFTNQVITLTVNYLNEKLAA